MLVKAATSGELQGIFATPMKDSSISITVFRNRVPRITLIKRSLGRQAWRTALRDAIIFLAGACTPVFLALFALVILKWHGL